MTLVEGLLPVIGIAVIRPFFVFAPLQLGGVRPLPAAMQAMFAMVVAVFNVPVISSFKITTPTELMLTAINEAITGLAIGLGLSMAVAAARGAGELIGSAIGLGFASLIDPQHGTPVPTIGQFLTLVSVALFLSLDGPMIAIRFVSDSYHTVPIGTFVGDGAVGMLNGGMDALFRVALQLAMPVLVATLGLQFALAGLARLAPQLNLFAVGFPATLIVGLIVFALAISAMGARMSQHWRASIEATPAVVIAR